EFLDVRRPALGREWGLIVDCLAVLIDEAVIRRVEQAVHAKAVHLFRCERHENFGAVATEVPIQAGGSEGSSLFGRGHLPAEDAGGDDPFLPLPLVLELLLRLELLVVSLKFWGLCRSTRSRHQ